MKKVLLTSTALVMTAGIAFADVSAGVNISGSAEIGIKENDANDADLQLHQDVDIDFDLAGETDGGLAFGATIDLDEVANGISDDDGPAGAFIAYGGWRLDIGDVDGALDLVNQEVGFFTSLEDDHTTHAGYFDGSGLDGQLDGQVATLQYTGVPGLILAVSAELGDEDTSDEIFGIGIQYNFDLGSVEIGASLGYQEGAYAFDGGSLSSTTLTSVLGVPTAATTLTGFAAGDLVGDAEIWAISLEVDSKTGFVGRFNYADLEGDLDTIEWSYDTGAGNPFLTDPFSGGGLGLTTDVTSSLSDFGLTNDIEVEWDFWGIGLAYETGAWQFTANYGEYDGELAGEDFDADGYGIAVNYDLGGGAEVQFGWGSGEGFFSDENIDQWSFGLGMSF